MATPYSEVGWVDGPLGGTPLDSPNLTHMDQGIADEDLRNPSSPASLVEAGLYGQDVRAWAPFTAYALGQAVVSPTTGDVVTANTAHTSAATYSGLVSAGGNWNLSSTFEKKGVALQVTEAPITPYRYGAVNPAAGSDNTAALLAMFTAAAGTTYPSGASIYIPPGLWRYSGTAGLPLSQNMVVRGAGRRTRLASVGAQNLFETTASVPNVNFENMWLECTVAGKAVFGMGATGGVFGSTFKNLLLLASNDTAQIWSQNGTGSFIQNTFQDCEMQRTGTSTVVPFSVITTSGNANFNQFNQVRFDGLNNVNTPFFHAESTGAATYIQDWSMINILGEANPGGLIRVKAGFNWTIINATDEDATTNYVVPLIDFQPNASSFASANITIMNSGRRGSNMAAAVSDISVNTTGANVSIVNCNTTTSQNTAFTLPLYANVIATRGRPGTYQGAGSPEGVVSGVVGSTWLRTDGGASTSFYVKESGISNTGWIAK
jgi:hypothetical protein